MQSQVLTVFQGNSDMFGIASMSMCLKAFMREHNVAFQEQ